MMKLIISKPCEQRILSEKSLPKAEGLHVSHRIETIGKYRYIVVREWKSGEILHKFKIDGTKLEHKIYDSIIYISKN